jgi:peptidoglycan/xylan/chitin deacetylase (PgdA/CDA1 family)
MRSELGNLIDAAAAVVSSRRRPPLVCLGFHSVDGSGSQLSMPVASFERLIGRLAESGFHGISAATWRSGAVTGGDPIILTFDDGFESVHSVALAALIRHGFTATVYPISQALGAATDWRVGGRALPRLRLLGATQLLELQAAGWEVGAHTRTHRHLPSLEPGELVAEVEGSKHDLEDLVGRAVTSFAYPYGGWTPEIAEQVGRLGFSNAWTTRPGRIQDHRLLALARHMLPPRATFTSVRAALGPALPALHWALAAVDRSRGRQPRYQRFDAGTQCSRFVAARAAKV